MTEGGQDLVDNVLVDHVDYEERLLACLSAEERQQLATLLRTLLIGLGDVPPQPAHTTPGERVGSQGVAKSGR